MATIRRNATKKIRAIAAQAIRVKRNDSSDMGVDAVLEGDEIEKALADFFEWDHGRAYTCEGVYCWDGQAFRCEVLRLVWHRNFTVSFFLTAEPTEL